jgi:hypothetical protein
LGVANDFIDSISMTQPKINSLTNEQNAVIADYIEKWQAIKLSNQPINREKATNAVKAAYAYQRKPQPKIIFVESPCSAFIEFSKYYRGTYRQFSICFHYFERLVYFVTIGVIFGFFESIIKFVVQNVWYWISYLMIEVMGREHKNLSPPYHLQDFWIPHKFIPILLVIFSITVIFIINFLFFENKLDLKLTGSCVLNVLI